MSTLHTRGYRPTAGERAFSAFGEDETRTRWYEAWSVARSDPRAVRLVALFDRLHALAAEAFAEVRAASSVEAEGLAREFEGAPGRTRDRGLSSTGRR